MTFRNIISGISGILLFAACHDIPFFTQYRSVEATAWSSRDVLVYQLPEVDSATTLHMKVAARTVQNYKYNNLVLIARTYEDKTLISTDTISYQIYGNGGEQSGTGFHFVEHELPVPHPLTLLPQKKYKVRITHIMRLNPLEGVSEVGVSFSEK